MWNIISFNTLQHPPLLPTPGLITTKQNLPVLSVEGWSGLWLPKMFILVLRFYRRNELLLNMA